MIRHEVHKVMLSMTVRVQWCPWCYPPTGFMYAVQSILQHSGCWLLGWSCILCWDDKRWETSTYLQESPSQWACASVKVSATKSPVGKRGCWRHWPIYPMYGIISFNKFTIPGSKTLHCSLLRTQYAKATTWTQNSSYSVWMVNSTWVAWTLCCIKQLPIKA